MPSLRALQLFSASLQGGSVGPSGRAQGQVEQAGCTGSTWSGNVGAMPEHAPGRGGSKGAGKGWGKSKAPPAP
eukprot:8959292-Alexandrium_andersonii.AAC.1